MSDKAMDMIDQEIEMERSAESDNETNKANPQQSNPIPSSISSGITAVEKALNLMTLSPTNNQSPPRLPTSEEVQALLDANEALRAGNESSLSAQVHLEKARKILNKMGHISNVHLLCVEEKLEVESEYERAERDLEAARQILDMAAVWLGDERARVRERMK
ncbi:MAG: hypothetical protein M1812_000094 [Candelaria pacifica]|nr:MAG: hypothetical protein M1812_000094 [Candelaria pacifica]